MGAAALTCYYGFSTGLAGILILSGAAAAPFERLKNEKKDELDDDALLCDFADFPLALLLQALPSDCLSDIIVHSLALS